MAGFIQPNTPTTKPQTNGIRIFIFFLLCLLIGLIRKNWRKTWHEITYDSYIVDVRRVRKTKAEGYSKAVAEVCKYALKFSDLSTENTWQAFFCL